MKSYKERTPIGYQKTFGFWDRNCDDPDKHEGGVASFDVPLFSEKHMDEGESFRELRQQLKLSIGEAARKTGLTTVQVSLIERGAASVDNDEYVNALMGP